MEKKVSIGHFFRQYTQQKLLKMNFIFEINQPIE
jgi:hypothetical protein